MNENKHGGLIMDMGYLLSFLAGMCIAIVICDIISHKFFKRKRNKVHFYIARNKVHFYVARDKNNMLYLYLGKPYREGNMFLSSIDKGIISLGCNSDLKCYGLNENDYDNLKWEDEPVEVFLNLED